jgi:hypothetical protein
MKRNVGISLVVVVALAVGGLVLPGRSQTKDTSPRGNVVRAA